MGIFFTLQETGINELHLLMNKQVRLNPSFHTLNLVSSETDVVVKPTNQKFIQVDLKASKESRKKLFKIDVVQNGGQLNLIIKRKEPYKFNVGVFFYREVVEVYVPYDQFQSIKVATTTADIHLTHVIAGNLSINTNSGDVAVKYNQFPKDLNLSFQSSSGEADLDFKRFHPYKQERNHILAQSGTGKNQLMVRTVTGGFHLLP